MSPWLSNKPAGAAVAAADCCPPAAFLAAETSSNINASAVNEAIFFLCTVKSPMVQNEKGTLGRTMEIVNLRDLLQQGQCSLFHQFASLPSFPFSSLACYLRRRKGDSFMSVNKVILVGRLGRDPET